MHFNFKNYQFSKTRKYFIENNFFFLTIGANQNAQNWLSVEQGLNKLKLNYHKIYNNIAVKLINESTYKNSARAISSTFFFIKPENNQLQLNKNKIFKDLNLIRFTVLAIKLNNRIYTRSQIINLKSLNYKNNISIIYQFLLTNLKLSYTITKK